MRNPTNILFLSLVTALSSANVSFAANEHNMHMQHHDVGSKLTEAGNDAFGTIQEALQQLINDPKTDWSKVNMEALRQHLVDMRNFTLNVEIIKQTNIKKGIEVVLTPDNERTRQSLERVFSVHPAQLNKETGWDMKIYKHNNQYKVVVTTEKPKEVSKIQGLGYIGVMAWGNHHQSHHWMMAKGGHPHSGHPHK